MNIKTISTVLISKDWYYLWKNWELPKRYKWDKEFITNLIKDKIVLCSEVTLEDLPKSITRKAKYFTTDIESQYDINFWIWTFKINSDMFIVIKSDTNLNWWKQFRMDAIIENYDLIMNINNIMLFFKKDFTNKKK